MWFFRKFWKLANWFENAGKVHTSIVKHRKVIFTAYYTILGFILAQNNIRGGLGGRSLPCYSRRLRRLRMVGKMCCFRKFWKVAKWFENAGKGQTSTVKHRKMFFYGLLHRIGSHWGGSWGPIRVPAAPHIVPSGRAASPLTLSVVIMGKWPIVPRFPKNNKKHVWAWIYGAMRVCEIEKAQCSGQVKGIAESGKNLGSVEKCAWSWKWTAKVVIIRSIPDQSDVILAHCGTDSGSPFTEFLPLQNFPLWSFVAEFFPWS